MQALLPGTSSFSGNWFAAKLRAAKQELKKGSASSGRAPSRSTASACALTSNASRFQFSSPVSSPWDTLGGHKSAALRRLISAADRRLWHLPPYLRDLNPIKQAFAKIKHWMHWMHTAQKRTHRRSFRGAFSGLRESI